MSEQPIIINTDIIVPIKSPALEQFLVAMAAKTCGEENLLKFSYDSDPREIRRLSPYVKAGFQGDTARGVDGGVLLAFSDSFIATYPHLFDMKQTKGQTIQLKKPNATARKDDLLYLLYTIKSPSGLTTTNIVVKIVKQHYIQLFNGTPIDPRKEPLKFVKETPAPAATPTLAQRLHAFRPKVGPGLHIAGTGHVAQSSMPSLE